MYKNSSKKSRRMGFSLIELLVVIAIIGILSSVVLYSLSRIKYKADNAVKSAYVKEYVSALYLYYDDHGYYPTPNKYVGSQPGGFGFYSACLKLDTKDQCVFQNKSYDDPLLDLALDNYMNTPLKPTLPIYVNYPNSSYGRDGTKADVGGIEYDCTPVAPGGSPSADQGNCQSYMITWVIDGIDDRCAGGNSMQADPGTIGYQTTNSSCVYTNNIDFANAFWSHSTLPAPYF